MLVGGGGMVDAAQDGGVLDNGLRGVFPFY